MNAPHMKEKMNLSLWLRNAHMWEQERTQALERRRTWLKPQSWNLVWSLSQVPHLLPHSVPSVNKIVKTGVYRVLRVLYKYYLSLSPKNSLMVLLFSSPFYWWGNWDPEKRTWSSSPSGPTPRSTPKSSSGFCIILCMVLPLGRIKELRLVKGPD